MEDGPSGKCNLRKSQADFYRMDAVAKHIRTGWTRWQRRGFKNGWGGRSNPCRGHADVYRMDRVAKAIYTGAKPICIGWIGWPMHTLEEQSRPV